MINISDLLAGYSNIKNPLVEKREVVDALNNTFNLNIKEKDVFFRKNVLILKINSVQKIFVFMNKDKILSVVNGVVPDRFINTIQF